MYPVARNTNDRASERGAVMVLVAVWLPLLALFVSFGIDVAHFFDYSRNLQNRADAAALAAGLQYGGACFATPTSGQLDAIGHAAQQYSGPPGSTADLPYSYASVPQYENQPNLTSGTDADFHLLLNASKSWADGGRNFQMGTFCASTYDDPAHPNPATDVWVTQAQVPLFFPMLGFKPNISAHARVQLQGAGSTNSLPIAVPDPAQTPCLRAEVIDDRTGALVKDNSGNNLDVAMTPPDPSGTPPTTFWTATLPPLTVPPGQLSVQAYIPDDCNNPGYPTGGSLFDSQLSGGVQVPTHGLEFINTYQPLPTTDPATAAIGAVYLTPLKNCDDATEASQQDAYFYYFPKSQTNGCSVTVCANVKFHSTFTKTEVDVSVDGAKAVAMANPPTNCGTSATSNTYSLNVPIGSQTGRHTFVLSWQAKNQPGGTFNAGNPLQATYAAFSDGSDPSDDSGPITQAFIGDTAGDVDVNALQQGSTQTTLTVAFRLQGLELAQPGDPPTVLRAAVQNRKATGAFNCWGSSASGDAQALHDAIVNGCPNPVAIYQPTPGCVFLPTAPLTCGTLVPGNKRNKVTGAFQDRVESVVDNGKVSPCDAWQSFKTGTPISGFEPWNSSVADPRIMVLAVTAPADLVGKGGPNNSVRILGFATFYVTGYDGDTWLPQGKKGGNKIPNCSAPADQDEAYPDPNTTSKDQVWGHFIKYVAAGTSNGQPCNLNDVSICVPALTR